MSCLITSQALPNVRWKLNNQFVENGGDYFAYNVSKEANILKTYATLFGPLLCPDKTTVSLVTTDTTTLVTTISLISPYTSKYIA